MAGAVAGAVDGREGRTGRVGTCRRPSFRMYKWLISFATQKATARSKALIIPPILLIPPVPPIPPVPLIPPTAPQPSPQSSLLTIP